jgi:site-specific recombinase XerD
MTKQETLTDQYRSYLARVGKSPHTIKAYSHDASAFASWWEQTTGKKFDPQLLTLAIFRSIKITWRATGYTL